MDRFRIFDANLNQIEADCHGGVETIRSEISAGCALYTSAEPCCMCAGAMYWAGIGRLVYGLSERRLKTITGNHAENPTLDLPCRTVFAAGQRHVEVIGPLLEDEAAAIHAGVWQAEKK
jgi:tRNA(Arg) A34 adenosine deaminase TadA